MLVSWSRFAPGNAHVGGFHAPVTQETPRPAPKPQPAAPSPEAPPPAEPSQQPTSLDGDAIQPKGN
jgi:hypothetical protein